ncbi:electron-transferring-flavoproteindehydrogenase [Wickerhamomyces ciferrii]|uniref:Electron transfer flavoprotein-ubiquinone oxidoreductase n=1 Tax=Wickerhamomyces ciferrii (strain ATCC 14091 / BCRC 22168 / CBS 111 / JCM 3599 / NBRC 0793 / NRRL Y-1031 F-60-10) TaxID=1206466 RepID=K0KJB6_WICCF|nr:electron-transferring-flavoproteindehydrogenase [Wickerhamomyces ciferrii]CCH42222.1 electron-transferring-flavoproteindehydrogenase [Wickerhamomyces ciferrii]
MSLKRCLLNDSRLLSRSFRARTSNLRCFTTQSKINPIKRNIIASKPKLSTFKRFASTEVSFEEMDEEIKELLTEERAVDKVDVCIVGGGPSGLATAIKLKQLELENEGREIRVVVLEKAPDMGSHIVSGAVLEPRALRELFPDSEYYDENGEGIPLPPEIVTAVTKEHMRYLYNDWAIPIPEPPQMVNLGKNYIASLSEVVKYLAEQAEELGVEVYPSTAVSEIIYDEETGAVKGVATKDMGISKDGTPKDSFERGMEFHARLTVFSEGCHGSLSKQVINKYKLREGRDNQTYGLGIKEIWEVDPSKFQKGYVSHTMGYPLSYDVYGGGFMYHFGDGLVSVGLVIGLDYENPWVSPYQEFQKMKHHPFYSNVLEGGKCISYAARALNEGGLQSVPKLNFPGGVLVGASAGFMNVPKIKGTHTAMKSGMLAAEQAFDILKDLEKIKTEEDEDYDPELHDELNESPINLESYEEAFKGSWIYEELYEIRNVRPSFGTGLKGWGGMAYAGLETMFLKGEVAWTLHHHHSDSSITKPASEYEKIEYPKPDGKISFDILTSVSRTGTYHDENERNHLRIPNQDMEKHTKISYPKFKGVENRFCPAGVYEYVEDESSELGVKFQINSQNCIHCKTCDIKVPTQDINWTVPEGGGGPKYVMT